MPERNIFNFFFLLLREKMPLDSLLVFNTKNKNLNKCQNFLFDLNEKKPNK